uniref:Uncharacterized protein n=1 Tax=Piridium sociabile TaxID=2570542 RepID=A0A5B9XW28_9ALVE|nr:hypothetical protein [Piridium sociabile]
MKLYYINACNLQLGKLLSLIHIIFLQEKNLLATQYKLKSPFIILISHCSKLRNNNLTFINNRNVEKELIKNIRKTLYNIKLLKHIKLYRNDVFFNKNSANITYI